MVDCEDNPRVADTPKARRYLAGSKLIIPVTIKLDDDITCIGAFSGDEAVDIGSVSVAQDTCNGGSRIIHAPYCSRRPLYPMFYITCVTLCK
jgi:hypothetical protein